jgi:mycofactocin precursor
MDSISSQVGAVAQADSSAAGSIEQSSLIEDESLVEEISIDGMCGVY